MAAPVATEVWNNTHVSALANQANDLLFKIKNALITGPGAWTVVSSCGKVGGVTWTYGAADYWDTKDAVVNNTGVNNHSWIVLKQTGMGGVAANFQICIDLHLGSTPGSMNQCNFFVSYSAGFTGGALNACPTATDGYFIGGAYSWLAILVTGAMGANVMKTASGKCTRVFLSMTGGTVKGVWIFEEPKNTPSWWDKPYLACMRGGAIGPASHMFDYTKFNTNPALSVEVDTWDGAVYVTAEGAGDVLGKSTQFATADYNNEWICGTTGLAASQDNPRGFMGEMRDVWWVSDDLPDGTYMPSDGSKQFVVIGDILQPWDGTAIVFD